MIKSYKWLRIKINSHVYFHLLSFGRENLAINSSTFNTSPNSSLGSFILINVSKLLVPSVIIKINHYIHMYNPVIKYYSSNLKLIEY